jgi:hypothetical protein
MSGEFVANYVQDCLLNGIQLPADMRKCAEDEIQSISLEISKIEKL